MPADDIINIIGEVIVILRLAQEIGNLVQSVWLFIFRKGKTGLLRQGSAPGLI